MEDKIRNVPIEYAVDFFLSTVEQQKSQTTYRTYERGLAIFEAFASYCQINRTRQMNGAFLQMFKSWRKDHSMKSGEDSIKNITLSSNLAIVKTFLNFSKNIQVVSPDLPDKVPEVDVSKDAAVSTSAPDDEFVEKLRAYLDNYHYASREHVVVELLCEIAARIGAVYALDIGDYNPEEQYLSFRHRPEKPDTGYDDTSLKNQKGSERIVNLPKYLCTILDHYIEQHRPDVVDKYDRRALITTKQGRAPTRTLRQGLYKITRPCVFQNTCTVEGVSEDNCSATKARYASKCDGNFAAHAFRKWSIMHQLNEGIPIEKVSNRTDVSVPVLKKHYDIRSKEKRAEARLEIYEHTMSGYGNNDEGQQQVERTKSSSSDTIDDGSHMAVGEEDEEANEKENQTSLSSFSPNSKSPALGKIMPVVPLVWMLLSYLV